MSRIRAEDQNGAEMVSEMTSIRSVSMGQTFGLLVDPIASVLCLKMDHIFRKMM
jgi:hypothetical protein